MLGFCARLLGYSALAGAMAAGIVDGARSIADGGTHVSSLAVMLETLLPRAHAALGPAVSRLIHPAFWDPLLKTVLLAPASPVLFVVGFGLLMSGRRGRDAILPPE